MSKCVTCVETGQNKIAAAAEYIAVAWTLVDIFFGAFATRVRNSFLASFCNGILVGVIFSHPRPPAKGGNRSATAWHFIPGPNSTYRRLLRMSSTGVPSLVLSSPCGFLDAVLFVVTPFCVVFVICFSTCQLLL